MANDIFSPARFSMYVKQYAGENKKKLIQMALTIFGVLIFCAAIGPLINGCYYLPDNGVDPMWNKELTTFWMLLFFLVFICAASAFSSYDSRLKRMRALIFPASTIEKYLTYILFYVVGIYILFFVGMIFADYIRVWTAPIYANGQSTIATMPLKYFFTFGHMPDSGNPMSYYHNETLCISQMLAFNSIICIQAFFILAAAIWPKHARLRGFLSLTGITIAVGFILYVSMRIIFNIYGKNLTFRWESEMENITFQTFITSMYIIGIVVTIGLYLLSYRRFKEMESIDRW